ncbi:MAG TPA: hypothetical protein DCY13_24565 [Verrucomicrobiales bacterium]|nr:hypothetical protein [Verrucomicrobiales bacterium]
MEQEPDQKGELLPDDEEEYGGPVKSFLDHLEDLRWMLIKVVTAVAVGMLVCLVAAQHIIAILTWPLDRANRLMEQYFTEHRAPEGGGIVYFELGTNVWRLSLSSNEFRAYPDIGTNQLATFRVSPVSVGTNTFLGLRHIPDYVPEHSINPKGQLINLGPFEGFRVAIQVALYGGIALASPFIFLFIGQFVLPALKRSEKKLLYQMVVAGAGLFILGLVFCYFALMQVVILAAVQFSNWLSFGADQWRASDYIGTVCRLLLGMGLGFELPVVVLTLVKLGLLEYETMRKFRPYWIVINLIISAVIMPPDGLTMFMMAIPLQILFEISLMVAKFWKRQEKRKAA